VISSWGNGGGRLTKIQTIRHKFAGGYAVGPVYNKKQKMKVRSLQCLEGKVRLRSSDSGGFRLRDLDGSGVLGYIIHLRPFLKKRVKSRLV